MIIKVIYKINAFDDIYTVSTNQFGLANLIHELILGYNDRWNFISVTVQN